MKKKDFIQIVLNILACLILLLSKGGNGSFWGFITFNIIAGIILTEIILSKDRTAMWVWITKTITYIFLVIKFSHTMGPIKPAYILMIVISVVSLLISRHHIKNRAIVMWGQVLSYMIGGVMYIIAIVHTPEKFGIEHIMFWIVNCISYCLLIYEIIKDKKERVNLIIPVFAAITSLIYPLAIILT